MPSRPCLTQTLCAAEAGDADAERILSASVYDELRRLAATRMEFEREEHTLQPTALVHEAYMKLMTQEDLPSKTRGHFIALAAMQMRRILVDCARTRGRLKRAGDRERVDFDEADQVHEGGWFDALCVHEALEVFAGFDPRRAKIVEMRYFGGLSTGEIAEQLQVSKRTVERGWDVARAWLHTRLHGVGESGLESDS